MTTRSSISTQRPSIDSNLSTRSPKKTGKSWISAAIIAATFASAVACSNDPGASDSQESQDTEFQRPQRDAGSDTIPDTTLEEDTSSDTSPEEDTNSDTSPEEDTNSDTSPEEDTNTDTSNPFTVEIDTEYRQPEAIHPEGVDLPEIDLTMPIVLEVRSLAAGIVVVDDPYNVEQELELGSYKFCAHGGDIQLNTFTIGTNLSGTNQGIPAIVEVEDILSRDVFISGNRVNVSNPDTFEIINGECANINLQTTLPFNPDNGTTMFRSYIREVGELSSADLEEGAEVAVVFYDAEGHMDRQASGTVTVFSPNSDMGLARRPVLTQVPNHYTEFDLISASFMTESNAITSIQAYQLSFHIEPAELEVSLRSYMSHNNSYDLFDFPSVYDNDITVRDGDVLTVNLPSEEQDMSFSSSLNFDYSVFNVPDELVAIQATLEVVQSREIAGEGVVNVSVYGHDELDYVSEDENVELVGDYIEIVDAGPVGGVDVVMEIDGRFGTYSTKHFVATSYDRPWQNWDNPETPEYEFYPIVMATVLFDGLPWTEHERHIDSATFTIDPTNFQGELEFRYVPCDPFEDPSATEYELLETLAISPGDASQTITLNIDRDVDDYCYSQFRIVPVNVEDYGPGPILFPSTISVTVEGLNVHIDGEEFPTSLRGPDPDERRGDRVLWPLVGAANYELPPYIFENPEIFVSWTNTGAPRSISLSELETEETQDISLFEVELENHFGSTRITEVYVEDYTGKIERAVNPPVLYINRDAFVLTSVSDFHVLRFTSLEGVNVRAGSTVWFNLIIHNPGEEYINDEIPATPYMLEINEVVAYSSDDLDQSHGVDTYNGYRRVNVSDPIPTRVIVIGE